jgi:branched-subunit amino acid permease
MRNKNLILNPAFLICLVVLFLNDHFFKFYYTSWFTGKLSDIAGIILLPMLLTYLFPKLKQNSVFVAGLLFTFWKSPFSEGFIKVYNSLALLASIG